MTVSHAAMRRLMREITQLRSDPPEGIRIVTDEENLLDVTGIIAGPEGTPYEGGYFKVKFQFTEEFPAAPPKCWFATKIFHPNVSKAGEICVNTLKKDWKKEYGIAHILVTVKCLLIYPNPESALDEAAGKLLLENYEDYCRHARVITSVHATPKVRPVEFDTPTSSSSTSGNAPPQPTNNPVASTSAPTPVVQVTPVSGPRSVSLPVPLATPTKSKSLIPPSPSTTLIEPLQSSISNGYSFPPIPAPPTSSVPSLTSRTSSIRSVSGSTMNTSVGKEESGPLKPSTMENRKPVAKRPAAGAAAGSGVEKRKKGLKRL